MNSKASDTLERLLESALDAVIVVDKSGIVLRVNQPAVRLFGMARNDILGSSIESVLPARSLSDLSRTVDPTSQPRLRLETRREAHEPTVEVHAYPVRVDGEGLLLIFAREASERHLVALSPSRAQESLQRSERAAAAGSMAASIAHDLNNWL